MPNEKTTYIFVGSETEKAYLNLRNAIWEKEYNMVDWHWTRLLELALDLIEAVRKDCVKNGGGTINDK